MSNDNENRRVRPPESGGTLDDYKDVRVIQSITPRKRGHKSPIPAWAMNDQKLQNVVAAYLERRAGIQKAGGSPAERIRGSEDRLWARIPGLERRMMNIISEFCAVRELVENGVNELPSYHRDLQVRKTELEKAISCLDGEMSFVRHGASRFLIGVLYRRYRLFFNSADIAEEFRTTPVHIRRTISKLNRIGAGMYGAETCVLKETSARKFVSFPEYEELSENSGIPFTLAA